MKIAILIIDFICIIFLIASYINLIKYLNKNEDKKMEEIRENLEKRVKIMQIITLILIIITICVNIDTVIKNM